MEPSDQRWQLRRAGNNGSGRAERTGSLRLRTATKSFRWTRRTPRTSATGRADRPIVRIHLLGAMRATSYLGDNILPRGRKARAMLGCLCLAAGARVPRSRLAAMLWDRVPDFQAPRQLPPGLSRTRRGVRAACGRADLGRPRDDRLNTSVCWIDARRAARRPTRRRESRAQRARGALQGRTARGARRRQRVVRSMAARASARASPSSCARCSKTSSSRRSGPNTEASERAEIARRLIVFDPTHEGASRILMRALADMGERAQALREYARCREALKRGARRRAVAGDARAVRGDPHVLGPRGAASRSPAEPARRASSAPKAPRRPRRATACASACCRSSPQRRRRTSVWRFRSARRSPPRSRASAGST